MNWIELNWILESSLFAAGMWATWRTSWRNRQTWSTTWGCVWSTWARRSCGWRGWPTQQETPWTASRHSMSALCCMHARNIWNCLYVELQMYLRTSIHAQQICSGKLQWLVLRMMRTTQHNSLFREGTQKSVWENFGLMNLACLPCAVCMHARYGTVTIYVVLQVWLMTTLSTHHAQESCWFVLSSNGFCCESVQCNSAQLTAERVVSITSMKHKVPYGRGPGPLTRWRLVPSVLGLGSMGNACCSKISSSSMG